MLQTVHQNHSLLFVVFSITGHQCHSFVSLFCCFITLTQNWERLAWPLIAHHQQHPEILRQEAQCEMLEPAINQRVTLLQRHAEKCGETCQFLRRVNSIRPGRCPPETYATGAAARCVTACETDADCEQGALKCCSNSCGWTCQQALHIFDGIICPVLCLIFFSDKNCISP